MFDYDGSDVALKQFLLAASGWEMGLPGGGRVLEVGSEETDFATRLRQARPDLRVHPTQKPESLMRELVALYSESGETILDPFMGSGTTLGAAKRLGRKAIGIELEEKYCEIAARRLRQESLFSEQSA